MRATFHQFFRPTITKMDEMLAGALISYDANVLLNVYRYSDETQHGLVNVFKAFADRTFLAHQVALEYARNRAKTIVDQITLCETAEKAFRSAVNEYIKPKNKQPFLSAESLAALDKVIEEIAVKRKALDSLISEDNYADLLLTLFESKIGTVPNKKEVDKLHSEAEDRYTDKIPPGYSDLKDKEKPKAYGDYIVWRQLMDLAKEKKKDFIFVTDDAKEDWRFKIGKKTIGPRHELLEEFHRETGQYVWFFTSESFLIATKNAGAAEIMDSVIKEVSENLNAQNSPFSSDKKLTIPNIEKKEMEETGLDADPLILGEEIEDKQEKPASSSMDESASPDKKTAVQDTKKSAVTNQEYGDDE
ncbi:hypothetical protein HK27_02175 [Acetobacter orientalis]|uniref:PIN domain-containing protein n=1 Tax=Acetobacter orientalis TaxID=146474 RepID=UPI000A3777E4|nr:PIN domain-containing protein [Acetobacter orientalis]OUJ17092.1 hypothetical protein HK27_02175 [Acetobacter orientalis]